MKSGKEQFHDVLFEMSDILIEILSTGKDVVSKTYMNTLLLFFYYPEENNKEIDIRLDKTLSIIIEEAIEWVSDNKKVFEEHSKYTKLFEIAINYKLSMLQAIAKHMGKEDEDNE